MPTAGFGWQRYSHDTLLSVDTGLVEDVCQLRTCESVTSWLAQDFGSWPGAVWLHHMGDICNPLERGVFIDGVPGATSNGVCMKYCHRSLVATWGRRTAPERCCERLGCCAASQSSRYTRQSSDILEHRAPDHDDVSSAAIHALHRHQGKLASKQPPSYGNLAFLSYSAQRRPLPLSEKT